MSIDERTDAFLLSKHLGTESLDCRTENPLPITKIFISYDSNYAFNIPRLGNTQ